jgi:hypothetical protein
VRSEFGIEECPVCGHNDRGCEKSSFKLTCKSPEHDRPAAPPDFDYCGWSTSTQAHLYLSTKRPTEPTEPAELPEPAERAELPAVHRDRPIVVRLADVTPQPIKWVWPGRIAAGKLTLISGDPGRGKSLLTHDLAARITTGGRWPLSTERAERGTVLFAQAEDGLGDTLHPRIAAAGGDLHRVYCLTAIETIDRNGLKNEQPFVLTADIPALEEAIVSSVPDVRMIVIDPVAAFMGQADSNDNSQVRAALAPLAALADRTGVAILCVQHLRKSDGKALHKSIGSIGYVAAARAVFVVCDDPDDDGENPRRLLLASKMNIAPLPAGLAYSVEDNGSGLPIVVWSDSPVAVTADEALAPRRRGDGPGRPATAIADAVGLLEEKMRNGPVEAGKLIEEAAEAGISRRTLMRAKDELGLVSKKAGRTGWFWSTAADGDGQADGQV